MSHNVFRNTSYLLAVFVGVSAFAASSNVSDGASWDDRFLAFSSAVTPWMVSATIVWAAGEIIKAINERAAQPSRDDA